MMPYIDVRWIWPIYVQGLKGTVLETADRLITVEDAEKMMQSAAFLQAAAYRRGDTAAGVLRDANIENERKV